MIGGIFLEIPFGSIYHVETLSRVRTNINRLFGFRDKYFTKGNWDRRIVNRMFNIAKTSVSKHRGDVIREHLSRSGDLIRSTAMGVFLDGKWDGNLYRFNGGPDHEAEPLPFTKHPDKDSRATQFMSQYKPSVASRFTVVIAVTMPYAVRVEYAAGYVKYDGFALAVLKLGINRIGNDIFRELPESMKGKSLYGYIFERNGQKEIKKKV